AEQRLVPGLEAADGRRTPPGQLQAENRDEAGAAGPGGCEDPKAPPEKEEGLEEEEEEEEEEELDPRIQEELERLNEANEEINRVELELDEARTTYRRVLSESARKLDAQGSQLGACVEKSRPYYEARRLAKEVAAFPALPARPAFPALPAFPFSRQAQQETQRAALRYERAVSLHSAAREMVFVAEQGVLAQRNRLDPTWQEMLNHATSKVNEAEAERLRSEREHAGVTRRCQAAEAQVQALHKALRRLLRKSRPYFELKAQLNQLLEEHKAKVTALERRAAAAKSRYSAALRSLERLSEQIHARRRLRPRAAPVGAEAAPAGNAATAPDDGASVLSLQTIASDLQKFDSVEHLLGMADAASLHGPEEPERRRCRHQRSVSL
ncbi:3BP5L protein, partial [Nothocercus julius]|nr:3BP5L protein [Nothocercus julius]